MKAGWIFRLTDVCTTYSEAEARLDMHSLHKDRKLTNALTLSGKQLALPVATMSPHAQH